MSVSRLPPAPNSSTKPLPHSPSNDVALNRRAFKPTEEELQLTRQILFSRGLNPEAGSLKGEQAREVFNRSALPFPTLRDIWSIADSDGSGDLTRDEIVMALRLIGWVQSGETLSEELLRKVGPLPTLDGITDVRYKPRRANSISQQNVSGSPGPSQNGAESVPSISLFPAVNQDHVQEFRVLFARAGPTNGFLSQDKVMNVYMTSNLSFEDLRKIIHAVARRSIDMLDFAEFACGLYVLRALQSSQLHSVPSTIPTDIYDQFDQAELPIAGPSSSTDLVSPPQARSPASASSEPGPSPLQLLAAPLSQPPTGRQSVPPTLYSHRSTPSLNLPRRESQTPGPRFGAPSSSMRHSIAIPDLSTQAQSSVDSEWEIPTEDRNTYYLYFYKLDDLGKAWIEKEVFDDFVKIYRLRREDMDSIWRLTSLTSSDQMNLDEFVIAMHLVKQCSRGRQLPHALPLSLIPLSLRGDPSEEVNKGKASTPQVPPYPPPHSRTDSESLVSPVSSPKAGKKPPPVPPKKGSISYKKPQSPVVSSPPYQQFSSSGTDISESSSSGSTPNIPVRSYNSPSKPPLKSSVSSSPSVPSISEGEPFEAGEVVTSPFEDPGQKSFPEFEVSSNTGSRRNSSGSASAFGFSDSTSTASPRSFAPAVPPLPPNFDNGSPPNSQSHHSSTYQAIAPASRSTSNNASNEVLEGFKEEISRLGRQVETLLEQLAGQNTIRDTNDALRIENEILKTQVKDTERMMNDVLASSLQQEAARASEATAGTEREAQTAEEIWRLMAEVSTKETRIEDLERRVEGLSREERELRDSLRESDSQSSKAKADAAELERKLEGKDEEVRNLEKRLAELERAMMDEVVNSGASGSGASGSGSGGNGSGSGGRSRTAKANANKDDPSLKELKVLIRDVTKENEGLKEQLRDMQRGMEQMLMSGSRGAVEETERENRRLKAQVSELETMMGQMQASFGEGSSSSRKDREAMEQMKGQLKEVQRAFAEVKSSGETRIGELQQRIESLGTENNRLKMELHEAHDRERRGGGRAQQGEDENVPPPAYDPFDANVVS